MRRDDDYTRLLGEMHRVLSNSVPKKEYDDLARCMVVASDSIERAVRALESPDVRRDEALAMSIATDLRLVLEILDGHLHDPWVVPNDALRIRGFNDERD